MYLQYVSIAFISLTHQIYDMDKSSSELKEAHYLAEERNCSVRAALRSLQHKKKIAVTNITKPKKKRKK